MNVLRTENLSVNFDGFRAVDNCSIAIEENKITALIGPNGAGKTTLFNLLAGTFPSTEGAIFFQEKEITKKSPRERFQLGMARTFQIPHEFHRLTVLENLMVVPLEQQGESLWANWFIPLSVKNKEKKVQQQAWETLEFLELTSVANELAGKLSGGQKKLLELGRAMMSGAKFMLLDEIAAGVNRTLLRKLEQKIIELNEQRGYTFLLIEHDTEMVQKLSNKVICMVAGSILAEGSFVEIRNHPTVLEAYLGEAV
jgi:branched-chain amino acid transport system ATP-binding protein